MSPILALIIANIVWGAGLPIYKNALHSISPFTLAFLRFFFASLIFLPFALKYKTSLISRRDWVEISLGSFFAIFINIAFLFFGLEKASSISGGVFAASQPIFFVLLSVILLKEKLNKKVLHGVLIALFGISLIIFAPLLKGGDHGHTTTLLGDFFYFISTMGAVIGPLIWKKPLSKINTAVVTYYSFFFSAILFFPFMVFEWQKTPLHLTTANSLGIVYGVLGSSSLAYFLFNYGISKLSTQEVGIYSYLNPIGAMMIAIPLLHEYPDIYFLLGSVLVFFGIYISEKHKKKFR